MPAYSESPVDKDQSCIKQRVMSVIETLEKRIQRSTPSGLLTGFFDLDSLTNGFQGGEMIVIAARPSMGKTSFALSMVEFMSIRKRGAIPGAVFSLEVPSDCLVERMICSRAGISRHKVRAGMLGKAELPRLMKAATEIAEAPLWFDDSYKLTIEDFQSKARQFKKEHDISYIVIDNLQRLRAPHARSAGNREHEIEEISMGVKQVARELDIPVIVLAQLGRKADYREGGPRLSDIRESGAIEQEADLVGLLIRSEYYADDPEEQEELTGLAELVIAKNRNGPTGDVALVFRSELMRFENRIRDY